MISIVLDNVWPATIPLPYFEYSGRPRYSTISSPIENGFVARRSRFTRPCLAVAVSWVLLPAEIDALRVFFSETLGNGTALFSIEMRYPLNSELTEWTARFRGGFQATAMEGVWNVTSELELINPLLLGELAPAVGAEVDYELFDEAAGLTVEELSSPSYPGYEYLDINLGDIVEEDATDDQIALTELTDDALGSVL